MKPFSTGGILKDTCHVTVFWKAHVKLRKIKIKKQKL